MSHSCKDCNGFSRRKMLGAGLGGFLGFAAARQSEVFGAPNLNFLMPQDGSTRTTAKSVIVVWLGGGPTHIDTWDPKEGHENGGPVKAIETSVPGVKISEYLPRCAKVADKIAIIRGMTSKEGSHERGRYLMHTGYVPGPVVHPSFGSIVAMEVGDKKLDLPNFISLGAPTEGAGFLPPDYSPFVVNNPGGAIPNLAYPQGVNKERFRDRMALLAEQEKDFVKEHESEETEKHKTAYEKADRLMHTPLLKAFDLTQEKPELLKAYGADAGPADGARGGGGGRGGQFGKGCVLARRLVEAGVRFVEVSLGGWDTHQDNFTRVPQLCSTLDPGVATLVQDLHDRRMLESTLVVVMGEFGRTPKINQQNGRDHYPRAWSAMVAGGGIKGGRVVGETDAGGAEVKKDPVTVPELFATFYTCLGVDYSKKLNTPLGNRIVIVDNAKPVQALIS
jgi:hypothetical protein